MLRLNLGVRRFRKWPMRCVAPPPTRHCLLLDRAYCVEVAVWAEEQHTSLTSLLTVLHPVNQGLSPKGLGKGVGWFVGGQTGWRSVSTEFYAEIGCRHI